MGSTVRQHITMFGTVPQQSTMFGHTPDPRQCHRSRGNARYRQRTVSPEHYSDQGRNWSSGRAKKREEMKMLRKEKRYARDGYRHNGHGYTNQAYTVNKRGKR